MVPNLKPHAHMRRILHLLHDAGYESAMIAGGAIRDMYHEVPMSDVDIFVQYQVTEADPRRPFGATEWESHWANLFVEDTDMADVSWSYSRYEKPADTLSEEQHKDDDGIVAVWNVNTDEGHYQVIFTNMDPIEYVNRKFDFGICKAYFDGKKLHYSRDFMRDSRNRTITLVGEGLTHHQIRYACEQHLPRIQKKYPGYKFQVESGDGTVV